MNKEVFIYGLVDPNTNQIRYVGKTVQKLNRRLSQHMSDNGKHNPHKFNWIAKLKKDGIKPKIVLLEECTKDNWVGKEKEWIQKLDNLTNLTQGGEDGLFFTEEILKKISDGVKKANQNPEYKKRQSETSTEYWSNLENRKRQSDIMKAKNMKVPQKHKDKLSKIKKELWEDTDYRNKMSEQSRNLWEDIDYKTKVLSYLQSDEHKEKVSKRFKGKKLSEEHKQKMSKNSKNKRPVIINGIEYESITEASKKIPMNRDKLRVRLSSKNFSEYYYKTNSDTKSNPF